jgi:hypothetical protein
MRNVMLVSPNRALHPASGTIGTSFAPSIMPLVPLAGAAVASTRPGR